METHLVVSTPRTCRSQAGVCSVQSEVHQCSPAGQDVLACSACRDEGLREQGNILQANLEFLVIMLAVHQPAQLVSLATGLEVTSVAVFEAAISLQHF